MRMWQPPTFHCVAIRQQNVHTKLCMQSLSSGSFPNRVRDPGDAPGQRVSKDLAGSTALQVQAGGVNLALAQNAKHRGRKQAPEPSVTQIAFHALSSTYILPPTTPSATREQSREPSAIVPFVPSVRQNRHAGNKRLRSCEGRKLRGRYPEEARR